MPDLGSAEDEAGNSKLQFWVGFTLSSWLYRTTVLCRFFLSRLFVDRHAISETWGDLPKVTQLRVTELGQDVHVPPSLGTVCCSGECGTEGPKNVIQGLESHDLCVGPVASHLHGRLWGRWTRGSLMASLGSCFPSEVDGLEWKRWELWPVPVLHGLIFLSLFPHLPNRAAVPPS